MPNTTNIGLSVPTTGSQVGVWGSDDMNPNFSSIDGLFGGVVTVSLSSSNVTLTAPGVSISPAAGPYQSQNAIVNLTGTLTANVRVTLPLPGVQRIANFTTGNFVVSLGAASAGEILGLPQGAVVEVFNDGTNVKFINQPYPGTMWFLAGVTGTPTWISSCTKIPWLLCNNGVYNYSDYPYLAAIIGGSFGGNGITTFATPDLGGSYPVAYDYTGTRITVSGCGINGGVIGAKGGNQSSNLTSQAQLPPATFPVSIPPQWAHNHTANDGTPLVSGGGGSSVQSGTGYSFVVTTSSATNPTLTGTASSSGSSSPFSNVSPAQICGVWLIKT